MKKIVVILMMMLSFNIFAESVSGISLDSLPSDEGLSITNVVNIYGKCGDAVVAILEVEADNLYQFGNFKVDAAGKPDLLLRNGGKDISFGYLLSDFNTVRCVQTKRGARLLVGSNCGGSACSDAKDYSVIDPKTKSVYPAKNSIKRCDENCVNQFLGFKYLKTTP